MQLHNDWKHWLCIESADTHTSKTILVYKNSDVNSFSRKISEKKKTISEELKRRNRCLSRLSYFSARAGNAVVISFIYISGFRALLKKSKKKRMFLKSERKRRNLLLNCWLNPGTVGRRSTKGRLSVIYFITTPKPN